MITNKTDSLEAYEKQSGFLERVKLGIECSRPVSFKDGALSKTSGEMSELVLMDSCKVYEHFSSLRVIENAAAEKKTYDSKDLNLSIAASRMQGLNPRNHLEATLASQMLAVDSLISRLLSSAMDRDQSDQSKDMTINQITKLQRTFLKQTEAFQKLRTTVQTSISVENVTVNSGGQAIVGASIKK